MNNKLPSDRRPKIDKTAEGANNFKIMISFWMNLWSLFPLTNAFIRKEIFLCLAISRKIFSLSDYKINN